LSTADKAQKQAASSKKKGASKSTEKPAVAAKETSNDKDVKKKAAPKKKTKGDKIAAEEDGTVVASKPSSKKATKKPPKTPKAPRHVSATVSEECEELDGSPTYAVAVASRTMSAGIRRRNIWGVKQKKVAEIADAVDEDAKDVVEVLTVTKSMDTSEDATKPTDKDGITKPNAGTDAMVQDGESHVSSDATLDKDEESNGSSTAEVAEDPVEQEIEVIDVDESENVGETTSSEGDKDSDTAAKKDEHEDSNNSNVKITDSVEQESKATDTTVVDECEAVGEMPSTKQSDADGMIDVDCEEEKASAPEEKVNESTKDDDDSDDDTTVAMEETDVGKSNASNGDDCVEKESDIPTEIVQPQTPNDSTDEQEDPSEDDVVVVVDVTKKSVLEELLTKENAKESSNEALNEVSSDEVVVVVDAPQSSTNKPTKSKKKSTKPLPKPRKKAAASSNKSKKKISVPEKRKGLSPIAASFKKVSACTPKKTKVTNPPAAKQPQVPLSTTVSTDSKSATASTANKPQVPSSTTVVCKNFKSDNVSAATASNTANKDTSAATTNAQLSEEDTSRLKHYTGLREKYVTRATELGDRPTSDDFEEESLSLEGAAAAEGGLPTLEKGSVEVGEDGEFPDMLLSHLLLIVQGRSLPLSTVAKQALDELSPYTTDARPLTIESISSKIKLLAQRKSYLSGKPPATPSEKSTPISKLDCFENSEECYMWRWELVSIDLLPQKEVTEVKKARSVRRKLQGHHRAIMNLIAAIDKAIAWLQNGASKSSTPAAKEKLTAKVSEMEEKVLKFERGEEKARLLTEAKLRKQKSNSQELVEKQREKDSDKKRQKEEIAQKKLEAAKEREETKRKKNEEKELEKQKKKQELEGKENKRKARMMSFFHKGAAKKKQKVVTISAVKEVAQESISTFDSNAFRKLINSQSHHVNTNPFAKAKLSPRSTASRRRQTQNVRVSVFVTVLSENAFAPQPYDEERIITVPNRYKFLGFHEDVRPPYRGTWSKSSSIVTGRRPYGKDAAYLDYENDSEEEWEEGDEEEGEDLQDGDDGVDEEDDMQRDEEDNDGWLAAEDDLGIEDEDDETRELRKKKLSEASSSCARPSHFKACVVAPRMGGLSHETFGDDMVCVVEGFSSQDAMDALTAHVGCVVTPDVSNIYLDAFPPSDSTKDTNNQAKKDSSSGKSSTEMSPESQKTMAQFVHNSTQFKSKENLVTELLKAHPSVTNSRAHAMRELDVIAEKRRLANAGGVIWEVKASHLKSLGLKKKDLKKPPKEASPPKASDGGDKSKKEKKDPNAPKRNMTAYIIYSNATRSDVKVANPNASFGEIAQIISKNYKALTSEERASWDEKAAADKERYQKEMTEYTSTKPSNTSNTSNAVTTVASSSLLPKASKSQAAKLSSAKKRKKSEVSPAQANLFASFLKKKPKTA